MPRLLGILLFTACAARADTVPSAIVAASPFERNLNTLFTNTTAAGEYSFDLSPGGWVARRRWSAAVGRQIGVEFARVLEESLRFLLCPLMSSLC